MEVAAKKFDRVRKLNSDELLTIKICRRYFDAILQEKGYEVFNNGCNDTAIVMRLAGMIKDTRRLRPVLAKIFKSEDVLEIIDNIPKGELDSSGRTIMRALHLVYFSHKE